MPSSVFYVCATTLGTHPPFFCIVILHEILCYSTPSAIVTIPVPYFFYTSVCSVTGICIPFSSNHSIKCSIILIHSQYNSLGQLLLGKLYNLKLLLLFHIQILLTLKVHLLPFIKVISVAAFLPATSSSSGTLRLLLCIVAIPTNFLLRCRWVPSSYRHSRNLVA